MSTDLTGGMGNFGFDPEENKPSLSTAIAYNNAIEKVNAAIESAKMTQEELQKLLEKNGSDWPQTQINPQFNPASKKTTGFLPPLLITPFTGGSLQFAEYKYENWTGQKLQLSGTSWPQTQINPSLNPAIEKTTGFLPPSLMTPNILGSLIGSPYNKYVFSDWAGQKLNLTGTDWPQTQVNPDLNPAFKKTTGFLPSSLLSPTIGNSRVSSPYAEYKFNDWSGQKLDVKGADWPQTQINPEFNPAIKKTTGFLPSVLLTPNLQTINDSPVKQNYTEYEFEDWRGQKLKTPSKSLTTEERFKPGIDLPRKNPSLSDKPHSTRDVPLIFGDARYDYFKHGLQVIDGLSPIENPPNGSSDLRLSQFKETPWEQNDPIYYGFDIIFDSQSSPLLNGSLTDFIVNYAGVSEIASKKAVYEEFKYQFTKFFRTTTPLGISFSQIAMTKTTTNVANIEGASSLYYPGKTNYLGYYLKKISGLDFLIEQNKGDTIKYTPEYKKDFITLELMEDVSISVGTLAHLYKTLYWSKPNGKFLIPENLLRFNCQIIVSECRNFNRVKRSVSSGNISVIKDNLARWIYSVRDCQFYFDKMSVPNDVDMGGQGPQQFETYNVNFDFKFSSVKLERFIPAGDWGRYVGYDGGAIWKVGNAGTRNSRGTTGSQELSTPQFFTVGPDEKSFAYYPNLRENGIDKPYVIAVYGKNSNQQDEFRLDSPSGNASGGSVTSPQNPAGSEQLSNPNTQSLENIAQQSQQNSAALQQQSTNQNIVEANNNIQKSSQTSTTAAADQQTAEKTGGILDSMKKASVGSATKLSQQIKSENTLGALNSLQKAANTAGSSLSNLSKSGAVADFSDALKKGSFGSIQKQLSDGALSKITKPIGTPLSQVVAVASKAKDLNTGNFFDKMNSIKDNALSSGGNLLSGGLSNISNLASGLTEKVKGGVPSIDSVKTKFSEAKTKATTSFFDVRGELKSSLTDGKKIITGGLANVNSLTSGLSDKIKSGVPSLDSVKNKFSEAKTDAVTSFFDVRGDLKSSLTQVKSFNISAFSGAVDQANSLTEEVKNKSSKAFGLASNLLNQELDKAKSTVGNFNTTEKLKEKFTNAKEISVGQFFDIRGQLSGDKGGDTKAIDLRANLLNNTIDKIYGAPKTPPLPLNSNTPPPTSFFDLKNQLKDFLGGPLGSKLTE